MSCLISKYIKTILRELALRGTLCENHIVHSEEVKEINVQQWE